MKPAPRIQAMVDEILRKEGGYVDDPDDAGGATNRGISLRYARGIGLDLDKDGDTDKADIKRVTRSVASELYLRDFYFNPQINTLPDPIQPLIFDYAVHSGPAVAIMAVQSVCNEVKRLDQSADFEKLVVDGRIGKRTIAAADWVAGALGPIFVNALAWEREQFLLELIEEHPKFAKFKDGWVARARSFVVEI